MHHPLLVTIVKALPSTTCLSILAAFLMAACQPLDSSLSASHSSSEAISAASLEPLLKRPSSLRSVKSDPSGAQILELPSGFHSVVMVVRHPDGSHSTVCTDSLDRATEVLVGTPRKRVEYQ